MRSGQALYAGKIIALAAVYYGAAKLGLSLAFATPSVTAVWPPTGIALAALVLGGYRLWPGIALGALLANGWTGVPFAPTVLGITVGNTLEGLVGAYLLRRLAAFDPRLERVRDVLALVALAAVVSTTVSATIGVSSLLAGDEISGSDLDSAWRTWWLGDMGGALLVAPALMIAVTHWPYGRAPGGRAEAAAVALVVAGLAVLVFTRQVPIGFVIFPAIVWAALRFWQLGAVLATLVVAAIGIPLTEDELGPFMAQSPDERLLLAQAFFGVISLTGLILAAVMTERQRAEDALERIAGALQESLLASGLPRIPGIETAIEFRPAGKGQLVGGDFYDVSASGDGAYGVVVGDAVGKGPMAAAITALARYTLRAASLREELPSRIMSLLNEAMIRQSPGHSCTVAYARLELKETAGARVLVSIGGHPPPLLLRADGSVEPIGVHAPPLGLQPDPGLTDRGADLEPGDALVLYTDGITDAYAPRRILSIEDVAETLRSASGQSAEGIAAALRDAALDDREEDPRDDILVFVLRVAEAVA